MRLSEVIEAVLFVSDAPMTVPELVAAIAHNTTHNAVAVEGHSPEAPVDAPAVETALSELMVKFAGAGYAFELKAIAGGYQFLTKQHYAPFVRAATLVREQRKLSRAALETLAIIAYRQPITRSEIEFIRGVNCEYALQRLLEKQLVEPAGRADMPGRPLIYRTSKAFMDYFGLASLADLPKLTELKADEEALAEAFRNRAHESETPEANGGGQGEGKTGPQQASLLEPDGSAPAELSPSDGADGAPEPELRLEAAQPAPAEVG